MRARLFTSPIPGATTVAALVQPNPFAYEEGPDTSVTCTNPAGPWPDPLRIDVPAIDPDCSLMTTARSLLQLPHSFSSRSTRKPASSRPRVARSGARSADRH